MQLARNNKTMPFILINTYLETSDILVTDKLYHDGQPERHRSELRWAWMTNAIQKWTRGIEICNGPEPRVTQLELQVECVNT